MKKIDNLSINERIISYLKRIVSGALVFVMLGNPMFAKGEENKTEGKSDVRIELATETPIPEEVQEEKVQRVKELQQISSIDEYYEHNDEANKALSSLRKIYYTEDEEVNALIAIANGPRCINIMDDLVAEGIVEVNPFDIYTYGNAHVATLSILREALDNPKKRENIQKMFFFEEDYERYKEMINDFFEVGQALDKRKVKLETVEKIDKLMALFACNGETDVTIKLDDGTVLLSLKQDPSKYGEADIPLMRLFASKMRGVIDTYFVGKNIKYLDPNRPATNVFVLKQGVVLNPNSKDIVERLVIAHMVAERLDDELEARQETYAQFIEDEYGTGEKIY